MVTDINELLILRLFYRDILWGRTWRRNTKYTASQSCREKYREPEVSLTIPLVSQWIEVSLTPQGCGIYFPLRPVTKVSAHYIYCDGAVMKLVTFCLFLWSYRLSPVHFEAAQDFVVSCITISGVSIFIILSNSSQWPQNLPFLLSSSTYWVP